MEVISAAASLSQKAVYTGCACRYLRHLYEISKAATALLRSQLDDLSILLGVLGRIEEHRSSDTEVLLPILISVATTAQNLSSWLNQSTSLRQKWVLVLRKVDIEDAFETLRQKCNLLIFHYSEQSASTLRKIEANLQIHLQTSVLTPDSMSSHKQPMKLKVWQQFMLNKDLW